MNFGDILNQWDEVQRNSRKPSKQSQVSHKKANAPTKEEKLAMAQGYSYEQQMRADNSRRANPMEVWLNRYGTVDKDKLNEEVQENARLHDINYLKSLRAEAVIDLHQLTRDEAWERMTAFVNESVRRGLKKIMFIHGKGNHSNGSDPVLGPAVKLFIEQDKRLGLSGHPDRNNGGNGATWVIIKQ